MFNTSIRVREFNAREKAAYERRSNETDDHTTIILEPCVKMIRNFASEEAVQTHENQSLSLFDDRECSIHFTPPCENRIGDAPSSNSTKIMPRYGTTGINHLFWSVPISQGFSAMKFANQHSIFEAIGLPAVNSLMQQHKNSTLVAYGIRGSGKSFTMFGVNPQFRYSSTDGANSSKSSNSALDLKEAGLFVRCLAEIFRRLQLLAEEQQKNCVNVEFSAYELENEQVRDLLSSPFPSSASDGGDNNINEATRLQNLEFRTPRFVTNELTGEVGIEGVKRIKINSCSDAIANLELGLKERSVRETKMSMLHKCTTVVEIYLVVPSTTSSSSSPINTTCRSQLRFIEFMGHDRVKKTSFFPGMNVDAIKNQSLGLNALQKCICAMLENQEIMNNFLRLSSSMATTIGDDKNNNLNEENDSHPLSARTKIPLEQKNGDDDNDNSHDAKVKIEPKRIFPIPFRESKITTIMKDVFHGKCKTYFVGCISPCETNVEESIWTCKFVDRWRRVNLFFDFVSREIVDCSLCDEGWLRPNPEYDSEIFQRANTKWLKELKLE